MDLDNCSNYNYWVLPYIPSYQLPNTYKSVSFTTKATVERQIANIKASEKKQFV